MQDSPLDKFVLGVFLTLVGLLIIILHKSLKRVERQLGIEGLAFRLRRNVDGQVHSRWVNLYLCRDDPGWHSMLGAGISLIVSAFR